MDDENFEPDTEYAARVRSSPRQAHYMGQWSDWSSEVQWKMASAATGESGEKVTTANKKYIYIFFYLPILKCVL